MPTLLTRDSRLDILLPALATERNLAGFGQAPCHTQNLLLRGFDLGNPHRRAHFQVVTQHFSGALGHVLENLLLHRLVRALERDYQRIRRDLTQQRLNAARLIVRRELKTDPAQVLAAVREAMAALPAAARNVRLHLHPEDALLVREHMKLHEEERAWKVVEDPALARGGCKVLTDTSQIDASLEARLTAILATVLGGERSHDRQP